MDTSDEIPLEDHRYFRARLDHLECQHPMALLTHLQQGTLTKHLRDVTGRGMQAKANLVINQNMPVDQAEELVMKQLIADSQEQSRVDDPASRTILRWLLGRYRAAMPGFPRTYQSESETTG
jgi:hypothetical protein